MIISVISGVRWAENPISKAVYHAHDDLILQFNTELELGSEFLT